MKKRILTSLGVLGAVVLVTPWATGYIAEKKIKEEIYKNIETPRLKLEILDYHRHWFTSDFDIRVVYKEGVLAKNNNDLMIGKIRKLHVFHGPIIFSHNQQGRLQFNLGQALIKIDEKNITKQNSQDIIDFYLQTLVSYTGNVYTIFNGAIDFKGPKGDYFKIPQFNGQGSLTSSLKNLSLNINIPQIQVGDGDGVAMQFNNLTLESNGQKWLDDLWLLNYNFHLGDATAQGKLFNPIKLNNFNIETSYNLENNTSLVAASKFNIQSINYDNKDYGPQILDMHVKLAIDILKEIKDLPADEKLEKLDQKIISLLLNKGIEINIDKLQLQAVGGSINSSALFKLNPINNPTATKTNLDPASMLLMNFDAFQAQLNVNVNKALLEELISSLQKELHHETATASQLIEEFAKRNLIMAKSGNYELTFNLDKGAIQLNGKHYSDSMEIFLLAMQAMSVNNAPASAPMNIESTTAPNIQ